MRKFSNLINFVFILLSGKTSAAQAHIAFGLKLTIFINIHIHKLRYTLPNLHNIYYSSFNSEVTNMKRMIGFILFWIAIGMTIMLFITNGIVAICIIILCLLLGYNLFCS